MKLTSLRKIAGLPESYGKDSEVFKTENLEADKFKTDRLAKLAGMRVKEAQRTPSTHYEETSDFDSDISDIDNFLKHVLKIAQSSQWQNHIKDTDENYSVGGHATDALSDEAIEHVKQAIKVFSDLYDHMQNLD